MSSEYKGVEVVGAGWGRTGTLSLRQALETLGFAPCYHMLVVMEHKHCPFWIKAFRNEAYSFREVFAPLRVRATCDFPSAHFWKEQLAEYPDAKVILTVRDPEKWYESCMNTILFFHPQHPNCPFGVRVMNFLGMELAPRMTEMLGLLYKTVMDNNPFDKANMINLYKRHVADVIRDCPSDKLLVFEVSQGWEPLCAFLNVPVPPLPFPKLNDTESFRKNFDTVDRMGKTIFATAVLAPIALVLYLFRKSIF